MNEPIATLSSEADLTTSTSRVTAEQLAAAARAREYWAGRHRVPGESAGASQDAPDGTPANRPD